MTRAVRPELPGRRAVARPDRERVVVRAVAVVLDEAPRDAPEDRA
ncbi:MAG: hypothetical protein U0353_31135 [Sandaracinus sp.]